MEVASRLFLLLLAALLVYALPTVNPQDNAEGTSKPPFRAKSAANPMFSQKQRESPSQPPPQLNCDYALVDPSEMLIPGLSLRYNKAKRQMQMASARLSAKQKGAQVSLLVLSRDLYQSSYTL